MKNNAQIFSMTNKQVSSSSRKLKAHWTVDALDDYPTFSGSLQSKYLNVTRTIEDKHKYHTKYFKNDVTAMAAQVLSDEIDKEIVKDLLDLHTNNSSSNT